MKEKTTFFTEDKIFTGDSELSLTPDRVFYSIDDCIVTQDVETADINEALSEVEKVLNKDLPDYVKSMSQYFDGEIPVITMTEYLRELKELSRYTKLLRPILPSKRFYLTLAGGIEVGSVIISDKYKERYILMQEVYINKKFANAKEYNLAEALKAYKEKIGINNN